MMKQKFAALVFVAAIALGSASGAHAEASADDMAKAGAMIQKLGDQAVEILHDPKLTREQRDNGFRELMRSSLNLNYLAQLALGRFWRTATPEERSAYLNVFDDYLLYTVTSRLTAIDLESQVVSGEIPAGKKDIFVDADVVGGGKHYAVRWRLRRFDDGLKIINLKLEAFSMMITTREEFSSVVSDKGMSGLIDAMHKKIDEMKAEAYSHSAATQPAAAAPAAVGN